MAIIKTFLTTTGANTWTVPADWNNSFNTIEVLGGGASYSGDINKLSGGGGAYSKISNLTLTPGASINYTVGVGSSNNGTNVDTWFNGTTIGNASVSAAGGGHGGAGVGGATASGVGTTKFAGGAGGGAGGSGAGGAAGPSGAGGAGSGANGGTGDNGSGGAGGTVGSHTGGNGTEFDATHGSGGGGYGAAGGTSGAGGNYGGGGGSTSVQGDGQSGIQGLIYVAYYSTTSTAYWVGGTGNWDASTQTHWADASGGTGGTSAVPSATNPTVFDASSGGGTATITTTATTANLTMTGYTGTLAGSSALSIAGSLTLGSGATYTYTGALTFTSTTSQTITSNGKSLLSAVTFNGSGGTWTLQDNAGMASATVTVGTLAFGSTTLSLSGTGTVWSIAGSITAGTGTIKLTDTSSSTKTFAGNGKTYYNFYITGAGTGTYTISGSNTFNDFKVDTPPHTVIFTAGTTQNLQTFTVNGTAGNLMTLQSTSSGTPWHLHKITLGTISCDYLSLQDSHVS